MAHDLTRRNHTSMNNHRICLSVCMLLTIALVSTSVALAATRLGDAGLERQHFEDEQAYPQMDHWAKTGVENGIPADAGRDKYQVIEVTTAEELVKAINSVEGSTMIRLAKGRYELEKPVVLKSGTILQGVDKNEVILIGRLSISKAENVGIEKLTLQRAASDEGKHEIIPPEKHAFRRITKGIDLKDPAAIEITESKNCWLDDVVTKTDRHPLALRKSSHITLRAIKMPAQEGIIPRGSVIIDESDYVLAVGNVWQNLRLIHVSGPSHWLVFRSLISGAGFYFHESDRLQGLLIEDCYVLTPPGYPFAAITKGPMPMGPDSVVMNMKAFRQGTDAIDHQLLDEDTPYSINRYQTRNNGEDDGPRKRFLSRYVYKKLIAEESTRNDHQVIEPQWDKPPKDVPVMKIKSLATMDRWVWSGNLGQKAVDTKLSDLLEQPLVPGTKRKLVDQEVEISLTQKEELDDDFVADPADYNRRYGQFGEASVAPRGGNVSFLKHVGNDWKGGLVLQRVIHIPGRPTLVPDIRMVGSEGKLFLNDQPLKEGQLLTLKPGYHVITAFVRLNRAMPLIRSASLELSFQLVPEPGPVYRSLSGPVPEWKSLYPYRAEVDLLADERPALQAWNEYFQNVLRKAPFPDIKAHTAELASKYKGTHVGWLLQCVGDVYTGAPHDEGKKLTPKQWSQLSDYYMQAGLAVRTWTINKSIRPPKLREYYPERAKEVK